ncbi:MAG TPA: hypothetical protein VHT04_08175 [Stellaceae bacterium]|nr:hypothetical protein [Stellaceae bacterium]
MPRVLAVAYSIGPSSLARCFVRGIDRISRRVHGIREFDGSDDCLLRIATGRVARCIRLSDGSVLRPGDSFVEVHLWNEHLAIPSHGADLRWAARVRRQFERSLRKLIDHLAADAAFAEARAVMMKPALADPQLEQKLSRIVGLFGFERALEGETAGTASLVERGVDNMWLWLLTWTFNPRSLKARRFARRRQELWISRDRLVALYGRADRQGAQAWRKARRATARGIS